MSQSREPIRRLYADWTQYRSRLVNAVRDLSADHLAISAGPDHAPIWALAAHCASVRTYWLCGVLGEPGAERTPFPDPFADLGWEDDLEHPRSAAELVGALETTDAIIERCLDTWTAEMLEVEFERWRDDVRQIHTRRSVVMRLLSHDAFHSGEISQLLGANGLPAIDLWSGGRPADRLAPRPADAVVRSAWPEIERCPAIGYRSDMILALHHIQLAMPAGREGEAEAFYEGLLGIARVPKPANLERRGGCWFRSATVEVHLGVEVLFAPPGKAHPAFLVNDLAELRERLRGAGFEVVEDEPLEGYDRFYTRDPFGNRIEFLAAI